MVRAYERHAIFLGERLRERDAGPERGLEPGADRYGNEIEFQPWMFRAQPGEQNRKIFEMLALREIGNDAAELAVDGNLRRDEVFEHADARRARGAGCLKQGDARLIARCFNGENFHFSIVQPIIADG